MPAISSGGEPIQICAVGRPHDFGLEGVGLSVVEVSSVAGSSAVAGAGGSTTCGAGRPDSLVGVG